jgi:TonB family protein
LALASVACSEDPRYLPAAELDARPYPLAQVDPEYPVTADGAQYYGKLRLNVYIAASGKVDRVEVIESGVPAGFRDAAVRAFAESRWEPGRKASRAVRSLKAVEVSFEPPVRLVRPPMAPES